MPKKISKVSIIFLLQIFLVLGLQDATAQSFQYKLKQLDGQVDVQTDEQESVQEAEDSSNYENFNVTLDKIDPSNFYGTAVIQALNKITAKTSVLEIKIGYSIDFGQISIKAHKCWKAPSDQKPESKILLEVFDNNSETKSLTDKRIFYGWMMSSSPSLSGLEHPIYDITAITCK